MHVKKSSQRGVLALILLSSVILAGCSGNEEKRLRYLESRSIEPLTMPAGMQQPTGPDRLPVVAPSQGQAGVNPRPPVLPDQVVPAPEADDQ